MEKAVWERAKVIFEQALSISDDERANFLATACSDDFAVRQEVEELLRSLDDSEGFMEQPAVREVASEIMPRAKKLEAGSKLLHYEIIRFLGEGGMGEVYLARDTKLDRNVAIKVLPAAANSNEEANRRLLREARSAARLDHPNICTIYEIAESEGRRFIVMQFMEGKSLAAYNKQGPHEIQEAVRIAIQIASALAAAHSNKIVHRDIKPANITISEKGQATVLDFGLAKSFANTDLVREDSPTSHVLSTSGGIIGTVPYMSPEQVKGEKLDARTDIFSFGALLYEMLYGIQPFNRESNAETIAAILNYDPPISDLPDELSGVLRRCLSKDKGERYENAADLEAELSALAPISGSVSLFPPSVIGHPMRDAAASTADDDAPRTSPTLTFSVTNYKWKAAAVLFILIVLGGIGARHYFFSTPTTQNQPAVAPRIDSLAVLPFENADHDTEYLSDGIAESLIDKLSDLPDLRVISRATAFAFKDKGGSPQDFADGLKVKALLTGKFSQVGDLVTIQADLEDLTSKTQLWGDRFSVKVTDLQQVQDEIAGQITEKLHLQLDNRQKARIAKRYTDNPEAYREYLKGRFYMLQYTPEGHKKALEHLNAAIDVDPTYALAYAGIADAYTTISDWQMSPLEALSKAKSASQKALDLDPDLAEAWAAHGHARLHEWDRSAVDDLNKAVELSPSTLSNQLWLGEYYMLWDIQKSIGVLEKAKQVDPLSAVPDAFLSFDYYMLRQPKLAIEHGLKAAELDPYFFTEHSFVARYYASTGDFKSAWDELGKIPTTSIDSQAISTKGIIFALEGKRVDAEKVITYMQKISASQYISPFEFALVYNALGDRDKTLLYLEKAFADRSESVGFIRFMPDFDAIRDDPRFGDLLRRAGLS